MGIKEASVDVPLRFRAKIFLSFAVVLTISAASLVATYIGLERITGAVASYRDSVSGADVVREIDRELVSYHLLARYYVASGKERDAEAAMKAGSNLKGAIDHSLMNVRKQERTDGLRK